MSAVEQAAPEWLKQPLPDGFETSDDWIRIVDFFVLHSPCLYQSNRRHSINDRWGHIPWRSDRTLKWPLNEVVTGNKADFLFSTSLSGIGDAFEKHHLLVDFPYAVSGRQVAVFTKAPHKGNSGLYMSFFYHLRNAIAHARFAVSSAPNAKLEFAFEDGARNKGSFNASARGVIRIESLIAVIDLIEAGQEAMPDVEKEILEAIESGLTTKKKIREELDLTDADWRTYSRVLNDEGKIHCDKQHHWSLVV